MAVNSRMPGIYFQTEVPVPEEALPRMDIAAFVGFASSGPLNTPVAVEDIKRFREIFGEDLPLARDTASGRMQYAYLAQSVEAFFQNGGRRCWIVRIADKTAHSNSFLLPGLVRADNRKFLPATVRARCEGAWSDRMLVGTVLRRDTIIVVYFTSENYKCIIDIAETGQLHTGDLVQLNSDDSDLLLLRAVESIQTIPEDEQVPMDHPVKRIYGIDFWFRRGFEPAGPLDIEAEHVAPQGEKKKCLVRLPDEDNPIYRVELDGLMEYPGGVLCIDFAESDEQLTSVLPSLILLLPVTSIEPSVPEGTVTANGKDGFWYLDEAKGLELAKKWSSVQPEQIFATRLTFGILTWKDNEISARLDDLAFCQQHPRFFGNLPEDSDLFSLKDGEIVRTSALEASNPRFPLAGPKYPASIYLPAGMPVVPDAALAQGPFNSVEPDTAPARNGLNKFSASIFVDLHLAQKSVESLFNEAWYKCYSKNGTLSGIHSLLFLHEVTIIAIPDAVQREWVNEPLYLPSQPVPHGPDLKYEIQYQYHNQDFVVLSWSEVSGAQKYILEQGPNPGFLISTTIYQGNDTTYTFRSKKNGVFYYRVRAKINKQFSTWSNTAVTVMPFSEFEKCKSSLLEAPELKEIEKCTDYCLFQWTFVENAASYTLQESHDPGFLTAVTKYQGKDETFSFLPENEGVCYYRVRAESEAEAGPWSNTEAISFNFLPFLRVQNQEDYSNEHLLAIQRSLLRLCAARGDVLAVLSLPGHYREEEALAHVAALKLKKALRHEFVIPLNQKEQHMLSFGALYHPWILTETQLKIPPDGTVCGNIARKANRDGAWVAPANESLEGITSLDPVINVQGWNTLFNAQVNLIRKEPRGFLILSAHTLSPDTSLQAINVRRLLILLRRLALREGMIYIFQPNNESFHRLVSHKFNRLLANLYIRGAFSGDTPEKAYRVVVDEAVNRQKNLELGRIIVELQVAPSRPMAFVTVRLIQIEHQQLMVQEV